MTGDEMVPHIERALRYVGDQSSAAPILRTVLKTHREDKRREREAVAKASQGGLFGSSQMAGDDPADPALYRPYSNATTSLEAAHLATDAKVQRERIFLLLEASHSTDAHTRQLWLPRHGHRVGLTADEIDEYTGLGGDTIRPRLKDLEKQRRIYKSELQRRTRKGRFAHIWKLVDPGPRP